FVIGPPLAAGMLLLADWRWIFLINLPLALAVAYFGLRRLPARLPDHPPGGALDSVGIALVVGLLASLALGINRVLDDWLGLLIWPWLLATVPLWVLALVRPDRGEQHPVVPLELFASNRLVLGSMVGSMGAGRALNRQGPRRLIALGFGLLSMGYVGVLWTVYGWLGFVLASLPLGLGLGVIVGGALRSIALAEAAPTARGAAQGLINIATAVGTLSATACISALADLGGAGLQGFLQAYGWLAMAMGALLWVSFLLPSDTPAQAP
ncbi:MAG: MFS transporter, partial [Limnohabitans sp.]